MKISLSSTDKMITLIVNGTEVPARIWQGRTDSGIEVHAYITRIAVKAGDDTREFERELQACEAPTDAVRSIPLRQIL